MAPCAWSAGQKLHLVANVSAVGYPATADAGATVRRPAAIYVRVISEPTQAVTIKWQIHCLEGGKPSLKTGSWRGASGKLIRVKLPVAKPASCITTAQSGAIRIMRLQILST